MIILYKLQWIGKHYATSLENMKTLQSSVKLITMFSALTFSNATTSGRKHKRKCTVLKELDVKDMRAKKRTGGRSRSDRAISGQNNRM